MDDKQAAAVLRSINVGLDYPGAPNIAASLVRGADALEFKAWLFGTNERGTVRACILVDEWGHTGTFLAYCEAKFEESRKHGN